MLRKYFGKCILVAVTMFLFIAVILTGAAIYFSKSKEKSEPADLVVVFPGEKQRIKAGLMVIKNGSAQRFMLIGTTQGASKVVEQRQPTPFCDCSIVQLPSSTGFVHSQSVPDKFWRQCPYSRLFYRRATTGQKNIKPAQQRNDQVLGAASYKWQDIGLQVN